MPRSGTPLLAVLVLLTGCGEITESIAPGAKGPVVFRVWDQQTRNTAGPPTVLTTDTLIQDNGGFDRLKLKPVDVRYPLRGGTAWIQAPNGEYVAKGSSFHLTGPVHFHGIQDGRWFTGTAIKADGTAGNVVLHQAELVRGIHVATSPRLVLSEHRINADGPFLVVAGTPAVAAALGAWE